MRKSWARRFDGEGDEADGGILETERYMWYESVRSGF